jgi:hypothetical protein
MNKHSTLARLRREALIALATVAAIMAGAAIYHMWWLR